jgi:hypothetical protein
MYESVYASLHQCLKRLYFNSKDTAKKRAKKGRVGAGEHRINVAYLEKLWEKQGGRCYYSGMPLNYDKHEWRVSIERLDTDEGYVDGNVVLCCLECNGKTQWTPEKIEFVAGYVLPPQHDVEFQPLTRKTGRGKFGELMNSAYTASGIRRRRMRDSKAYSSEDIARRCAVEINTAFLIGLYNAQKGLCAYSGFPMQFGSHLKTDWAMSLERRDTKAGYTPENVCLICSEFNTSDQSFTIGNEYGSAGWTPLKFEYFRAQIRHSKGLISEDELQVIADAQIKYKSRAEINTEKPPPIYGPRRKQVFNAQFHECLRETKREILTAAKKKYGVIYMITCPEGKRFIGKSDVLFQENFTICGDLKRAGYQAITNAIDEHGMENMKFEKLITCTKAKLEEYQEHFIQEYDTYMPNGYNVKPKFDEEIRDMIAESLRGKTIRYGHDGRLLPSCVKYIAHADRKGYGIVGHTRCGKKDFVSKKKDMETLYNDCIAYLAKLNA